MLETLENWIITTGAGLAARILSLVIIAVIGILLIKLVMKIINTALEKSKLEKAAHSLIKTLARTVMYVLLALVLASSLGIDVTGIVALASVVTLAISLSLQNMLSNIVGGFTLLYTHPFSSGDYVEVAGQSGTVSEIGMTYTKLITPDNKIAYIPNNAVVSAEIVNYTVTGTRRVDIPVSVSYDMSVQKVLDTLVSLADEPTIITEPEAPYAILSKYGESTIDYTLRFWTKTEDYWTATFAVNQKLKETFEKAGVEFSYPHLNIHVEK